MSVAVETVTLDSVVPDLTEVPDEISLQPGQETTVLLPSRAGAGYVWEAEVDDEGVVSASTKFEGADDAAVGRRAFGENELLTLRGRGVGTTRVHLVQRRTWEEERRAAEQAKRQAAVPSVSTSDSKTNQAAP